MTDNQRALARHALGLPNRRRTSYRNHFIAGEGHEDYADWLALVADGHAVMGERSALTGGDDIFFVTDSGKRLVMNVGEK